MPRKKPSTSLKGVQLRKFRSDIAKLKEKGIVSKRVDARSQKPTRHMLSRIKEFAPVLQGKAAVVKVGRGKTEKFTAFKSSNGFVMVPKEKGENIRYDKRTKEISGFRKTYGVSVRKIYRSPTDDLRRYDGRKNIYFTLPMYRQGRIERFRFKTFRELEEFVNRDSIRNFKSWETYVEIEEIIGGDADDVDGDE